MSMKAVGRVASWDVLPAHLRGLAFLVADYANADTGLCCPSVDTLARRCGVTRRGVQKALGSLETLGVIRRHHRFIEGRQTTSQYEILSPPQVDESSRRDVLGFAHEGALRGTPVGALECAQNQGLVTRKKENTRAVREESDFSEFWALYPKRVDRKRAERAWARLTKAARKKALAHLSRRPYADVERQFVPNPTTYIHGERWNDEALEQQPDRDWK